MLVVQHVNDVSSDHRQELKAGVPEVLKETDCKCADKEG